MKEWTLHYHYPWHSPTKTLEVYSLVRGEDTASPTAIIVAVPKEKHVELIKTIEGAMNGIETYVPNAYHVFIKSVFHGPWRIDDLTHRKLVEISEEEKRKIVNIIYRESAERLMAEANLQVLKQEFAQLQRAHEIQGQQLLRAQANARTMREDYPVEPVKYTDLLTATPDPTAPELPFEHASQVLCQRGGCGEI